MNIEVKEHRLLFKCYLLLLSHRGTLFGGAQLNDMQLVLPDRFQTVPYIHRDGFSGQLHVQHTVMPFI